MKPRFWKKVLLAAGTLSVFSLAAAAGRGLPPAPSQWVTDSTGFLSSSTRETLNARLRKFQRLTGNQVVVWIGKSTGDRSLEDWATETFKAWGIGRKGKDNGLALFILTQKKKIRIEVGYGLEGKVTDLLSFRVIHDILQPGFKAGRQDKAVSDAVTILLTAIDPKAAKESGAAGVMAGRAPPRRHRGPSLASIIIGILGIIGFLILFATNPGLAMFLLFSIMSGGRGGGGFGGGGGGFSGGGGMSGGGGASGSW